MGETSLFKLNHSMVRVTDPEASLKFYKHLGLRVLQEFQLPDHKLDLYFLAYDSPKSVSCGKLVSDRQGVLELSYSYGSKSVHNGNHDPKGFGYICISVDNIPAACKRLTDAGYELLKESQDGFSFILDPDEYWVKIVAQGPPASRENVMATDVETYRVHHTMLRIKDKDISLRFYQDVFGMTLKHTVEHAEDGFNSYFLGYDNHEDREESHDVVSSLYVQDEGLLELTWHHGTENEDGMVYHNGNTAPEGFGHICVSVDDITAACERFDKFGVSWQKRLLEGPFRVAFILDPDGYYIEIIQNEKYQPAGHEF